MFYPSNPQSPSNNNNNNNSNNNNKSNINNSNKTMCGGGRKSTSSPSWLSSSSSSSSAPSPLVTIRKLPGGPVQNKTVVSSSNTTNPNQGGSTESSSSTSSSTSPASSNSGNSSLDAPHPAPPPPPPQQNNPRPPLLPGESFSSSPLGRLWERAGNFFASPPPSQQQPRRSNPPPSLQGNRASASNNHQLDHFLFFERLDSLAQVMGAVCSTAATHACVFSRHDAAEPDDIVAGGVPEEVKIPTSMTPGSLSAVPTTAQPISSTLSTPPQPQPQPLRDQQRAPSSNSSSSSQLAKHQQQVQQQLQQEERAAAATAAARAASPAPTTTNNNVPLHTVSSVERTSSLDRRRQRHAWEQQKSGAASPVSHHAMMTTTATTPLQPHDANLLPQHRSHEDIEVLPNHKVQVRLPPRDHPQPPTPPPPPPQVVRPAEAEMLAQPVPSSTPSPSNTTNRRAPLDTLEVKQQDAAELARSISELTMRSSYAGAESSLNKIPDNRRMAYYAVGKHHRQGGRGGNRRCYFTGKLILGGAPFYAGSVQQGLRTLVVFCLPSALGLPKESKATLSSNRSSNHTVGTATSSLPPMPLGPSATPSSLSHPSRASLGSGSKASLLEQRLLSRSSKQQNQQRYYGGNGGGNSSVASKSMSRLSSLDDLSLSIEGDLDPNWGLDRDYLLRLLPPASAALLRQMADLYPEQFETLPIQVRDPAHWKLYVKFCFFSGLPIAEGEMHYKVRDDIAEQVYGEEIVLSHEVMEAVNGDSAEILTLPNLKTFRYLRKHYTQQCGKLEEKVFRRTCWERVAPEV